MVEYRRRGIVLTHPKVVSIRVKSADDKLAAAATATERKRKRSETAAENKAKKAAISATINNSNPDSGLVINLAMLQNRAVSVAEE